MQIPWLNRSSFPWLDSGPSPGVQQAFALGFQAKQNAADRELRARQLEISAREQDILNEMRVQQLEAQRVQQEGLAATTAVVSEIARDKAWTDPARKAQFWAKAAEYPQMQMHPAFRELTQQFELAQRAEEQKLMEATRITGRTDVEAMRQENRMELLNQRFDRMSEQKLDDNALRIELEKLRHEHRLEEGRAKSGATADARMDLVKSDEIGLRSELNSLQTAFVQGVLEWEEFQKKRDGVMAKYKARARRPATTPSPSQPKRLKFDPATGGFTSPALAEPFEQRARELEQLKNP